jgi:AICAR transformylase/IMP cyclohydrolase PurH
MSEIVQIVESNNITLLGLYISNITNNHTQVTLRLDTEDVNEVIQSFRRYNYKVLTHNKNDLLIEQFKNRADYLQKYLNI